MLIISFILLLKLSITFSYSIDTGFIKTISKGLNINFRENQLERDESYYFECLNRTLNNKFVKPINKTYLIASSTTLRLDCNNLCLNVNESVQNLWVYISLKSVRLNSRPINSKLLNDLSLEVKFENENSSATYYCINHSVVYAVHRVTVTDSEPFNLKFTQTKSYETEDINQDKNGLQILTKWFNWSQCSRCPIGFQKRVGICRIRAQKYQSSQIDLNLKYFNDSGIPCRSKFLPKEISFDKIRDQKSTILFSFCRRVCPKNKSSKLITKLTKEEILKKLSNSLDFIQSLGLKSVFVGQKVVISCTKDFNPSVHYIWRNYSFKDFALNKNNFHYINPMKIHIKTKGRVKIDFMNNLVINYALRYDKRVYSCYDLISNSSISVTKLFVRFNVRETTFWSKVKQNFGAVIIIITIMSFGFTLWINRKLKTKI